MSDPAPACPECRLIAGGDSPAPLRIGAFVVHPRPGGAPVPGWFVVAPVRHVEQLDALDAGELQALGPLLAELTAALRAETRAARVYVSVFAEVLPHLHVHVVARPPELPPEQRGPRLFLVAGAAPPAAVLELGERVFSRLRRSQSAGADRPRPGPGRTGGSRWKSALLSALVCPGVGQIRNRQLAKGLLLIAATLAATGAAILTITRTLLTQLPEDPAALGPLEIWALAEQVRAASASGLFAPSVLLVVLWVYGTWDAWRGQPEAGKAVPDPRRRG